MRAGERFTVIETERFRKEEGGGGEGRQADGQADRQIDRQNGRGASLCGATPSSSFLVLVPQALTRMAAAAKAGRRV